MDHRKVWQDVERVRAASPLVHNITNYVVMNTTANALLAVGASPVMAHAIEEVAEMAGLAGALVINIGTLSASWIEAMLKAGGVAKQWGIPVVLDPVGVGATSFRTQTARRLLEEVTPTIIRGNASEIRALADAGAETKGVDSTHTSAQAVEAARALSSQYHTTVVVSGATDMIVAEDHVVRVHNGHAMMPRVTGLGCTSTALVGAFAAVNPSAPQAAAHAMAVMGIAGEMAAEHAEGPGSFQVHFLDALYRMQADDIERRLRAEES